MSGAIQINGEMPKPNKNSGGFKLATRLIIICLCIILIAGLLLFQVAKYYDIPLLTEMKYIFLQLSGSAITIDKYQVKTYTSDFALASNIPEISGCTFPYSKVELSTNGNIVYSTTADKQGVFRFQNVKLKTGKNDFLFSYESTISWFKFCGIKSKPLNIDPLTPIVDNIQYDSTTNMLSITGIADPHVDIQMEASLGEKKVVKVFKTDDRGAFHISASTPFENADKSSLTLKAITNQGIESKKISLSNIIYRSIAINLGVKKSSMDIKIEILKDDKRVQNFLTGSISALEFFKSTIGVLTINGQEVVNNFVNSTTPEIEISDYVSIQWHSQDIYLYKFVPIKQNNINIELANGIPNLSSKDSVVVSSDDYELAKPLPLPQSLSRGKYIWGKSFFSHTPAIKLGVKLRGIAPLLAFLNYRLDDLVDYPFWIFTYLIQYLLSYIPVIWILLLLKQKNEKPFVRTIGVFIILYLMIPSFSIVSNLTDNVRDLILTPTLEKANLSIIDEWKYLIAIILAVGILIGVIKGLCFLLKVLISKLWPASELGETLSEVLKAIIISILFVMLSNIFIYLLKPFDLYPQWVVAFITIITGFILVLYTLKVYKTACEGFIDFRPRHIAWIALLAIPLLYIQNTYDILLYNLPYLFKILSQTWFYIPPLLFFISIKHHSNEISRYEQDVEIFSTFIMIIFAGYIVGMRLWMFIPIFFFIALSIKHYLLVSKEKLLQLGTQWNTVHDKRKELIKCVIDWELAEDAEKTLEKLEQDLSKGLITPNDYESKKGNLEKFIEKSKSPCDILDNADPRNIVFAFGPNRSSWENGLLALKRGLYVTIPFSIFYSVNLINNYSFYGLYYYLKVIVALLVPFLNLAIQSFFFGYFFEYIRGDNGFKKGLRLSILSIVCCLPMEILSMESFLPSDISFLVVRMAIKFIIFVFLGVAFDLKTLRENNYSWRKLGLISDVPSLATLIPVIIATISTTLISLLTGRISELITFVFNFVIPQINIK